MTPTTSSQTEILKVEDLKIAFKTNTHQNKIKGKNQATENVIEAVKGISFSLHKEETVALIGASGSGKSVTAYSILKLLPTEKLAWLKGKISFKQEDISNIPLPLLEKIRGGQIGMIFQDPMNSLNPTQTVTQQLGDTLKLHQPRLHNPIHLKEKISQLLGQVELSSSGDEVAGFANRYPHELSGGQKQRVMIALAIANNPEVLIADEPTTALDVTIQASIIDLLSRLKKELNLSLLFITHDLNLVQTIADRVIVMQHGKIIEETDNLNGLKHSTNDFTRELFSTEFKFKIPQTTLKKSKDINLSSAPLLSVENLSVEFPIYSKLLRIKKSQFTAVKNSSFSLYPGETLGVVGESGSGKSSLAQAILKLIPSKGKMLFHGQQLDQLKGSPLKKIRKHLQIVFQDSGSSLNPKLPIAALIAEGLEVHQPQLSKEKRDLAVDTALLEVGLKPEQKYRYAHEFSGGQRQRINLARSLILSPNLIILDEPTSSLDFLLQVKMIDLLLALQKKKGLAYIFITHDLRVLKSIADKIIVMKAGECVEMGDTRTIYEHPKKTYTKKLIEAALF